MKSLVPLIALAWATTSVLADNSGFELNGTVTATINGHAFILQSGDVRHHIFCPDIACPRSGNRLTARGHVQTDRHRDCNLVADSITPCGQDERPAPLDASVSRILSGELIYRNVRTRGTVLDAFVDEIDPRYHHIVLKSGADLLHVAIPEKAMQPDLFRNCVGAEISVSGICMRNRGGSRIIIGTMLVIDDDSGFEIIRPAPTNPFNVPLLEDKHHVDPSHVAEMGKRRIEGLVTAVWNGNKFMIAADDGRNVQVSVIGGQSLPSCGTRAAAVGYPETDLFHINLINAEFQTISSATPVFLPPEKVPARFLLEQGGKHKMDITYHGRAITLRGMIRGLPPEGEKLNLECDNNIIPVDISAHPAAAGGIRPGCDVEISGTCIFETENWTPRTILPRIKGVLLVVRKPDDIRVLATPPWWTPARLTIVIGSLLAALICILIWNRILNRVIDRRSRELFKEQIAHATSELRIGERTRLAVELHDSLSQSLAGIACQMAAVRNTIGKEPEADRERIRAAERMLKSCRTELRMCLFDLRSDMLEEPDFATAIRKSLEQPCASADIVIDFNAKRELFHDSSAHALLCIIRELATNALIHGRATQITVQGDVAEKTLSFSVSDNGCGFDPKECGGPSNGHFGLQGIRDRLKRLNGNLSIQSHPGQGTVATGTIPLPSIKETR